MKRGNTQEDTKGLRWMKTGGGFCYLRRNGKTKIIKPGQSFTATEEEVANIRDLVVPIDGNGNEVETKVIVKRKTVPVPETKVEKKGYTAIHKGFGKWEVQDSNGKVMNDIPLSKKQAEELVEDLGK